MNCIIRVYSNWSCVNKKVIQMLNYLCVESLDRWIVHVFKFSSVGLFNFKNVELLILWSVQVLNCLVVSLYNSLNCWIFKLLNQIINEYYHLIFIWFFVIIWFCKTVPCYYQSSLQKYEGLLSPKHVPQNKHKHFPVL